MPITDPLVLAADVSITPASELTASIRKRLDAQRGDAAITRLRGRSSAKLVSEQAALLLAEFRTPKQVAVAIRTLAQRWNREPDELLRECFPLLRDCYNSHFLVPADSLEAEPTLPSRDRGDPIGRFRVLRTLQVIDDTELHHGRDRDGSNVAIKLARPGHTGRARFRREVAALQLLDGTNAPRVVAEGTHRRRAWFAMTWCEGVDPAQIAAELRSKCNHVELQRLLVRIARAYAAIHRRGVLHGDVHLRNLLVDSRQRVRIVDFGLAQPVPPLKLAGRSRRGGVLRFHSPEQAAALLGNEPMPLPTVHSEQYSLAVLLYHLATGEFPFADSTDRITLLERIAQGTPQRFSNRQLRPWPELDAVLQRSLERDPARRYASIAALTRALARLPRPIDLPAPTPIAAGTGDRFAIVDRFVERVGIDSVAFRKPVRAPRASVMLGASGISYALYRIACLRNDPAIFALARAWQSRIERDADSPLAFSSPGDGLGADSLGPVSPFHAATGMHVVGALIALAANDLVRARRSITGFLNGVTAPWPRRDLTLGRMGGVLGCTLLIEALPAALAAERDLLRSTGDSILDGIWAELDRLGRIGEAGAIEDHGIAHGWGGLLWAALRWHDATGATLPDSFHARLAELAAGAEPLGRGVHWAQRSTASGPSILATHQVAGWCNGPAGMVHPMALAHVHFPAGGFDRLAVASAWSAWEAPAEIFDLCCGIGGRAYALLACHRLTGDPEWLGRAVTLTDRAAAGFNSSRQRLARPFSLFKGEAGLAVLAADMQHPEHAAFPFFDPEGFPRRE